MEDPNNEVIAVDNCFSGDKRNLLKWFGNPRFEFIRHDVCLPLTVEVRQRVTHKCAMPLTSALRSIRYTI